MTEKRDPTSSRDHVSQREPSSSQVPAGTYDRRLWAIRRLREAWTITELNERWHGMGDHVRDLPGVRTAHQECERRLNRKP
ncbi:MAG: hypothetical protein JXQ91_07510 [Vannielia sp.]|uniref:hypothetical protein n=1 Tax=Vannielia sp. TaxID=2813045 RepID=UPI003B8B554B